MTSGSDRGVAADEEVLVGRVVAPHGVRGEVSVEVVSDVEERFAPGAELLVRRRGPSLPFAERLSVRGRRPHKGRLLVHFGGVDDRDGAERLRGARLLVGRDGVPPAPEGHFYHFELQGCRCIDRSRGELGTVVDVVEDGGGTMLLVAGESERVPVPLVERFVVDIDVSAQRIEVDLPRGLIEACGSE